MPIEIDALPWFTYYIKMGGSFQSESPSSHSPVGNFRAGQAVAFHDFDVDPSDRTPTALCAQRKVSPSAWLFEDRVMTDRPQTQRNKHRPLVMTNIAMENPMENHRY